MTFPAQLSLLLALAGPTRLVTAPADTSTESHRVLPDHHEHPVVQAELDQMVSGRHTAFYHRALLRQPKWADLVDTALEDAGLPAWLAAVPLVESGYSNWGAPGAAEPRQSMAPGRIPGRGLWMFIPATARQYGLRVDDKIDERFDPELETDAAVALLTDLHDSFGDWGLALAAYNQGPQAVRSAIQSGGTRDVLELIEQGELNPYAAKVMAAAALLER